MMNDLNRDLNRDLNNNMSDFNNDLNNMSDLNKYTTSPINESGSVRLYKDNNYNFQYGKFYTVKDIGRVLKVPDIELNDKLFFVNDGKCCEGKVHSISYSCSTDFVADIKEKSTIIISSLAGPLQYTFDDIGKKIFFTREDAENYIKEQEEKNWEFDMVRSILTLNRNSFAYELFSEHEMYKKGIIMPSVVEDNEALWEYKNKGMETDKFARHRFICSACGSPANRDESGCCFELTPYCPYCGKKMVGLDLRLIED